MYTFLKANTKSHDITWNFASKVRAVAGLLTSAGVTGPCALCPAQFIVSRGGRVLDRMDTHNWREVESVIRRVL